LLPVDFGNGRVPIIWKSEKIDLCQIILMKKVYR
jgi:hypothetical protein